MKNKKKREIKMLLLQHKNNFSTGFYCECSTFLKKKKKKKKKKEKKSNTQNNN